MKKAAIILLFISFSSCIFADSLQVKLKAIRYSCMFVSGYADGVNDAISFHYSSFKKVHPNANDQFWNPEISWTNKYQNGTLKPRFFGSTSFFISLTDGYHFTNMLNRGFMIGGSIIIPLQHKPWWWYAKELGIDYLIDRIGFTVAYNLIYKVK